MSPIVSGVTAAPNATSTFTSTSAIGGLKQAGADCPAPGPT